MPPCGDFLVAPISTQGLLAGQASAPASGWSWHQRRAPGGPVAPSTVWEILTTNNIRPAPHRNHPTWATFPRSQAHALLAADFFEANTLTGAQLCVLTIIEHATHPIQPPGGKSRCHSS
ncbi:MAG TPA: hypothetical protein VK784_03785 [Pseudonocardiaceae bacterium]|nr:hypothetical protein [Pseudonocardiaceae bacterium]